jgi:dTDP-4-amino-4,6-dideoxygalactose transaminase
MPVPIPFLDLYAANRPVEAAFLRGLKKLYRAGAFIGGPAVEGFERAFAAALGAPNGVAVSSGTAALHLSLVAAGVGPGDEVIVPAFTFPGAAGPVLHLGARLVFVDVRAEDGCLDPAAVARAVTPRTRAMLATHLFGHPADMDGLRKALKTEAPRAALIEDAAQAHGGSWRGRSLGSIGDFGCFSFYPTKNLGGIGDAGIVLAKRGADDARLRRLRDHGQSRRFDPVEAGFNARMDALQALFLSLKLPRLARENARRAAIAAGFLEALGTRPDGILRALVPSNEGISAWHAFVVSVGGNRRAAFLRHLDAAGIAHQVYYPRALPALRAFRGPSGEPAGAAGTFPVAERLARSVVALPLHAGLDAGQQARIRAALKTF